MRLWGMAAREQPLKSLQYCRGGEHRSGRRSRAIERVHVLIERWEWKKMEQGASTIVPFHGTDDFLIPVQEARYGPLSSNCMLLISSSIAKCGLKFWKISMRSLMHMDDWALPEFAL